MIPYVKSTLYYTIINFPDTPITVERAQLLCKVDPSQFILKKKGICEKDDNDDEFEIITDSFCEDIQDSNGCSVNWLQSI